MKPNPSKREALNLATDGGPPGLAAQKRALEAEQDRIAKLEEAALQRQQKLDALNKERRKRVDDLQHLANGASAIELWIFESGEELLNAFTGRDSEGLVARIAEHIANLETAKRLLPSLIARRQAELAELDKQLSAFSEPSASN